MIKTYFNEGLAKNIEKHGTDKELTIIATMYNLGISYGEAKEAIKNIEEDKMSDYVFYFLNRHNAIK